MSKRLNFWGASALCALLGVAAVGYWGWQRMSGPATRFEEEARILLIPTGADFETVVDKAPAYQAITDEDGFRFLSSRKKYTHRVKPGRYVVKRGMSLNALVNKLRSGEAGSGPHHIHQYQEPAGIGRSLGSWLEPDSVTFLTSFLDPDVQQEVGLSKETFISLFLPDTYEIWWTSTPKQFVMRMQKEHDRFWTVERIAMADEHGLSWLRFPRWHPLYKLKQ